MQRHQPRRVACMCGRLMTTAQQLRRHLQAARWLTAQLPQQTAIFSLALRDARRTTLFSGATSRSCSGCSTLAPTLAASALARWPAGGGGCFANHLVPRYVRSEREVRTCCRRGS